MTNIINPEKIPLKFRKRKLDEVLSMKKSRQRKHQKNSVKDIDQK